MVIAEIELIDTHAHVTFPDFDEDRAEVLKRAWSAGLGAIVTVGAGACLEGNAKALAFAKKNENVFATVGIHPHDAPKVNINDAMDVLGRLAEDKKVVAIGEIGLDYHYGQNSKKVQLDCFKMQVQLAHASKLPIVIHDRDAHNDVLFALREAKLLPFGGVFHCFSGDNLMAREVTEMGFYLGIPGIITFKKSDVLKKVVEEIPIEKLVIETDCPYLAPEPYRGKRNEPSYVRLVAEEIAKIKKLSLADVARVTSINARRVFNLPGVLPMGKIAYPIRRSIYLNITNRCTLGCVFCPKRSGNFEVKGHNLRLSHEPSVEDVFRAIGDFKGYDEVVFCGFGEPTLRLELLKVIAKRIKESGARIRLDTDGLANLVHGRDVLPELSGLIDAISISMNAADAETYAKLCPSKFGEKAFNEVLSFIKRAKEFIPEVTVSVVGVPGLDVNACEKFAKKLGVSFRDRKYQEVG